MKYIICILISFTFSTLCLSQNELKVDVSYLKEKQFLLIKVKNESSSKSFGLFNGRIGTNEFDGSIIYIRESPQSPFSDDAMFLMWEYDEKADTLKKYRSMSWMNPNEEKCFGITLKNKEKWLNAKSIVVTTKLSIRIIKEGDASAVGKIKCFETLVNIR